MGKHKNPQQDAIFLKFMADHSDVARGFVKGDKVLQDQLWVELAAELNNSGPPIKDVANWKKAWLDWKSNIRKKLAHNKSEAKQTGGGSFNKFVLTRTEEELGVICGIYKVIDGIEGAKSFGTSSALVETSIYEFSSPSRETALHQTPSTSQRPAPSIQLPRARSGGNYLQFLKKENEMMEKIGVEMANLNENKENANNRLKGIEYMLKDVCTKVDNLSLKYDKIIAIKTEKLDEFKKQGIERKQHYIQMEQNYIKELEIQVNLLELKKLKLDAVNSNNF